MFVNSDYTELLKLFNANGVRYLVIGGYAVVQYTEPRYTKDLDLWVSTDPKNAKSVFAALREFGAPLAGMSENDFAEEGYFYQMGVPPVRVDILMGIPGVEFEQAWQNRTKVDFDGLTVPFISKADLISAKLAAGRTQDLKDAIPSRFSCFTNGTANRRESPRTRTKLAQIRGWLSMNLLSNFGETD